VTYLHGVCRANIYSMYPLSIFYALQKIKHNQICPKLTAPTISNSIGHLRCSRHTPFAFMVLSFEPSNVFKKVRGFWNQEIVGYHVTKYERNLRKSGLSPHMTLNYKFLINAGTPLMDAFLQLHQRVPFFTVLKKFSFWKLSSYHCLNVNMYSIRKCIQVYFPFFFFS
jgi:hypothetical protein